MGTTQDKQSASALRSSFYSSLLRPEASFERDVCKSFLEEFAPEVAWSHAVFFLGTSPEEMRICQSFCQTRSEGSSVSEIEVLIPALREGLRSRQSFVWRRVAGRQDAYSAKAVNLSLGGFVVCPAFFDKNLAGAWYLDRRGKELSLSARHISRLEEGARLFGLWARARERTFFDPLQSRFLEMGKRSFSLIHDLRNLFSLLHGKFQWMEEDSSSVSVEEIRRELQLGRSRLEELLTQDSGPDSGVLDLEEIARQAIARIPFLRAGDARISFSCEAGESYKTRARRAPLLDALTNLILNAVDATPWAGEVEIRLYRQARDIWIRITDRGLGMDADQLEKLFEPFRRSKKAGSVGLGLFSTKKIVEDCGGSLSIHSAPQIGTTVNVVLPGADLVGADRKKILVVDDEEDGAASIAAALSPFSFKTEIATEGRNAIAMACEGGFDLLLIDRGMHQWDGVELLRYLRHRNVKTPAILLSAHKSFQAIDFGFAATLEKPIVPVDLRAAVHSLLSA